MKNINNTNKEYALIEEAIISARVLEEYLWGEHNKEWNLEEWKRMFKKRIVKIDDIDSKNPHALIELKKRLIQNAALSIALLHSIEENGMPKDDCLVPSNLPQYKTNKNDINFTNWTNYMIDYLTDINDNFVGAPCMEIMQEIFDLAKEKYENQEDNIDFQDILDETIEKFII